jgi:AraC-like DNA-binding protein
MHRIQTAQPRLELRQFVRAFASREMSLLPGLPYQQPNLTCLEHTIAFELGTRHNMVFGDGELRLCSPVHYVGPHTSPAGFATFSGKVLGFAVFLYPLAPWQLFNIPLRALANRDFDAVDILGTGIHEVWMQLAESESFSQKVQIAEAYLLPFARNARLRTDIMRAAHHVFHHKGAIRIEKLAGQAGLSVRQFERRFIEAIGLTPKLFVRATRFQMALEAGSRFATSRSGLEIAHEFGYFDQAHMVRDFHAFGGSPPSQIEKHIGDMGLWRLPPSADPYYL